MKQTDIFDTLRQPDPLAVAADATMVEAMHLGARSRNGLAGTADRLPMAYRPGALDANALPSRFGDRLHYRDGRVGRVN